MGVRLTVFGNHVMNLDDGTSMRVAPVRRGRARGMRVVGARVTGGEAPSDPGELVEELPLEPGAVKAGDKRGNSGTPATNHWKRCRHAA